MSYIIDSQLTLEEALKQNPDFICPEEIIQKQRLLDIIYHSFDGKVHKGQIVVAEEVMQDVQDAFSFMYELRFPIEKMIPVADPKYHWSDSISVADNNTAGFNYRYNTRKTKISNHGYGRAIDINPRTNPYIDGDFVEPQGAIYNPSAPGAIVADDQIVEFFKKRGWGWGGEFTHLIDYQHFEKPL